MTDMHPLSADQVLQVGHYFRRDGCLFQITRWGQDYPLILEARAVEDGSIHHLTLNELFAAGVELQFGNTPAALAAPAMSPSPLPSTTDLPAPLLARARRIVQTVAAVQTAVAQHQAHWLQSSEMGSLTDATRAACQSLPRPISLSQYYVYRQLVRTHRADLGQIAAALRRRSYQKTAIPPNAHHFVDTVIRHFYRSDPPLRPHTVYRIAALLWEHNRHWWINREVGTDTSQAALMEHLLDPRQAVDDLLADPSRATQLTLIRLPSRSWFYSYLRWFTAQTEEGAQIARLRSGPAADATVLVFDRFVQQATLPLQYVCADHYQLDVLHVDDDRRALLPRLWLTVLIDAYSRAIVGFFLSADTPNIESIQGALRHAIWPKTNLTDDSVDASWPCFGIPQRLSLDNAWAHHSHSLEDLARAIAHGGQYTAMELLFRPPYQARYGALVERLFGNLSGQLRELLPGAVLPPGQRHGQQASRHACLLYRDVLRVLVQLLVAYMHSPHRELAGCTPHDQWLSGLQRMVPMPPPWTPQLERCFWRLHPAPRVATKEGLALFGLHYWDVQLSALRSPDRAGRPRRVQLRYDPADISRVAIFESGRWLGDATARELRLPDGRVESVSLWELTVAKTMERQRTGRAARPLSWLITLLETRALIAQRQAEQKTIRRKLQALQEQRRGRPQRAVSAEQLAVEDVQAHVSQQVLDQVTPDQPDARVQLLATLGEVL